MPSTTRWTRSGPVSHVCHSRQREFWMGLRRGDPALKLLFCGAGKKKGGGGGGVWRGAPASLRCCCVAERKSGWGGARAPAGGGGSPPTLFFFRPTDQKLKR